MILDHLILSGEGTVGIVGDVRFNIRAADSLSNLLTPSPTALSGQVRCLVVETAGFSMRCGSTRVVKSARVPLGSFSLSTPTEMSSLTGTPSILGPVIEMAITSLLNLNGSYAPLSTEDPGNSRYACHSFPVRC
ncbi:unnamed protein product [Microthlaspi erraticum]|uniref:Uncharacterized protein n=1 Tax=Microthlaspi erraticum TaxID=1685480 RepID=A0A6D2L4S9_9BRAS|nr:unnamed protein product [Microthlaspi erraticum]CAA7060900.1 unnamed protein product [Microthlaspi erraticum]